MSRLILLAVVLLSGCEQSTNTRDPSLWNNEQCRHGVTYYVNGYGVHTLLVDRDGKPLACEDSR